MKLYPNAGTSVGTWALILLATFACAVCGLASGCVPGQALTQARRARAINTGISVKEDVSAETRGVAEDNADAWSAQLYLLDGTRLPKETEERLRKRGQLPASYDR